MAPPTPPHTRPCPPTRSTSTHATHAAAIPCVARPTHCMQKPAPCVQKQPHSPKHVPMPGPPHTQQLAGARTRVHAPGDTHTRVYAWHWPIYCKCRRRQLDWMHARGPHLDLERQRRVRPCGAEPAEGAAVKGVALLAGLVVLPRHVHRVQQRVLAHHVPGGGGGRKEEEGWSTCHAVQQCSSTAVTD